MVWRSIAAEICLFRSRLYTSITDSSNKGSQISQTAQFQPCQKLHHLLISLQAFEEYKPWLVVISVAACFQHQNESTAKNESPVRLKR